MSPGIKKARLAVALMDDPWMGIPEAARALGMTRFKFMQLCMGQHVETQVVAGRTVISRESVEQLARELKKSA